MSDDGHGLLMCAVLGVIAMLGGLCLYALAGPAWCREAGTFIAGGLSVGGFVLSFGAGMVRIAWLKREMRD